MKKVFNVIIGILLIAAITLLVLSRIQYNNSISDYNDLMSDYNDLVDQNNFNVSIYNNLYKDYDDLLTKYDDLEKEYEELEKLYMTETEVNYESPSDLSQYDTNVTYEDIARKPEDYEGKAICLKGEVVQLLEGDDENDLRVAVNGDYDQMVYFVYDPNIIDIRILEEDTITMYGNYYGIYSYEATSGTTISIPLIIGTYVEIN